MTTLQHRSELPPPPGPLLEELAYYERQAAKTRTGRDEHLLRMHACYRALANRCRARLAPRRFSAGLRQGHAAMVRPFGNTVL